MADGRNNLIREHLLQYEKTRQIRDRIDRLKVETDQLVADTHLLLDRCSRLRITWLSPIGFDTPAPLPAREAKTTQKKARNYLHLPRKSLSGLS